MKNKVEERIYRGFKRDCIVAGIIFPTAYILFMLACKYLG